MTNDELKNKINKAFSDAVPDVYDRVLREIDINQGRLPGLVKSSGPECESTEVRSVKPDVSGARSGNSGGILKKEHVSGEGSGGSADAGVIFERKAGRKKGRLVRGFMIAAAAAAVAAGTVFGVSAYNASYAVASTVSIDVNPSIELKLNKEKKVLEVIPRSEDAVDVIGNMELKGVDLDVAVNALLGSMISKGYISDMANSILVSVDNADSETAAALQDMLMEEIDAVIGNDNISGAVIGQVISGDSDLSVTAGDYGITLSKAQLIKQITAQNPTLKFEDLVHLTINDLNLLKKDDTANISTIGSASDGGYIGVEKALDTALEDVGFTRDEVSLLRVDMDYENGEICYAVTFHKTEDDLDFDYNFDIGAATGTILSKEKELENIEVAVAHDASKSYLSPEEAKAIALSMAGFEEGSVYEYELELDYKMADHYDIEFKAGGKEYDYAICMYGGRIIKDKWEIEENRAPYADNEEIPEEYENKNFIGEESAKKTAFKTAGINPEEASEIEVEIEKDMGQLVYEVEFKHGIYSYSYDVDSVSGEIVDYEIDFNM